MNRKNEIKITKENLIENNQHLFEDIDKEILNYFKETIKLYVIENNNKINIPILLSTPERWKQLKEDRFLRDNKKQIILPIITIKRNTINFLPEQYSLPNKTWNYVTVIENTTKENKYNDYSLKKDNSIKNKYLIQVEPPTPIEIEYEIRIQTRYVKSMNSILEQLILNKNKGRIHSKNNNFNLKWEIDSFSDESNVEDFSDELRVITNSFSFLVESQIYNKYKNNELNVLKKFTPHKVTVQEVL